MVVAAGLRDTAEEAAGELGLLVSAVAVAAAVAKADGKSAYAGEAGEEEAELEAEDREPFVDTELALSVEPPMADECCTSGGDCSWA